MITQPEPFALVRNVDIRLDWIDGALMCRVDTHLPNGKITSLSFDSAVLIRALKTMSDTDRTLAITWREA